MPEFLLQLNTEKVEFANEKLGEEDVTSIVKIKNTQNEKYLYKIKSTSNELFRIRPPTGYLNPGYSTHIKVIFTTDKPVPESGKHYVVIYYRKAEDVRSKYSRDAWAGNEPEALKKLYINFSKTKKEDAKEEKNEDRIQPMEMGITSLQQQQLSCPSPQQYTAIYGGGVAQMIGTSCTQSPAARSEAASLLTDQRARSPHVDTDSEPRVVTARSPATLRTGRAVSRGVVASPANLRTARAARSSVASQSPSGRPQQRTAASRTPEHNTMPDSHLRQEDSYSEQSQFTFEKTPSGYTPKPTHSSDLNTRPTQASPASSLKRSPAPSSHMLTAVSPDALSNSNSSNEDVATAQCRRLYPGLATARNWAAATEGPPTVAGTSKPQVFIRANQADGKIHVEMCLSFKLNTTGTIRIRGEMVPALQSRAVSVNGQQIWSDRH